MCIELKQVLLFNYDLINASFVLSCNPGVDFMYLPQPQQYSFSFTGLRSNISVPIGLINDEILEGSERFFGRLNAASALPSNVKLIPDSANAVIIDDDGNCFCIVCIVQTKSVIILLKHS